MKQTTFWLAMTLATTTATAGAAQDLTSQMEKFVTEHVIEWATDPIIVDAIVAQNAITGSYDQAKINELDALWTAQSGMAGIPLIDGVLQNPTSDFLRQRIATAG